MSGFREDFETMHLTKSPRRTARLLCLAAAAAVGAGGVVAIPAAQAASPSVTTAAVRGPAVAAPVLSAPTALTNVHACSTAVPGSATPATLSCDLYAVAGTSTLVPGVTVATWTFSATGAASTTAPVIVMNQGDTVALTLHNGVTTPISLAVPGMAGNSSDTVGVAGGATSTAPYTFTATNPGTYLYEAGHTVNGPRAVAMGLVGAIVVRPNGFVAATPTDLGAATPFVDEAVLVLTDVDPAFTAAPLTYDLRNFHSAYRMINGKVYPSTDPIPTTAGDKVLLRYVNGGMVSHSMGVYNQRQSVVAINAHADSSGGLSADTMPAGQTEDVIVTAAEGRTPVYDVSGTLDNGGIAYKLPGNVTDTLKRVNFGGMMTLLTTTPVAPTSDTVGPKTTITVATSSSVTASFVDQISPFCTAGGTCGPSNVSAAEYFVDTLPAATVRGAALTPFPGGAITIPAAAYAVSVTGSGQHVVYVRAQDAAGNWGLASSALVTVVATGPSTTNLAVAPVAASVPALTSAVTITATGDATAVGDTVAAMEYFVVATGSAQPAVGTRGTAMPFTASGATAAGSVVFTATTEGVYDVLVRSQGLTSGAWGGFAPATKLTVDNTAPAAAGTTGGAVSPNPTNGTVGDPVDPTALKVQATFSDTGTVTTPIVAAEGFVPSPAVGTNAQTAPTAADNGHGFVFVANDGTFDGKTVGGSATSELAYGLIPLTQLTQFPDGQYSVWVHGRDAAGNWGAFVPVTFVIARKPTITNLVVTRTNATTLSVAVTATSLQPLTAAATFVGAGAPGTGTACAAGVGLSGTGFTFSCSVTVPAPTTGDLTIQVRLTSSQGSSAWTPVVINAPTITSAVVTTQNSATSYAVTVNGTSTQTFNAVQSPFPLSALNYSVSAAAPAGNGTACVPAATGFPYSCTVTGTAPGAAGLSVWFRGTNAALTAWTQTTLANALFSSTLDNATGWTASTTPAPAFAASTGITGLGLVVGPGGGTLTGPTPVNPAAVTYYASAAFKPGTLATGTNTGGWLTVATVTTSGGPVQVQYRRNAAATATVVFRLMVNGTQAGGTYNRTGVAANTVIPVGVRVTPGANGVALFVDNASRATGTFATTATVTGSVLGNQGTTGTVTLAGAGYLDVFGSNRFAF